MPRRGGLVEAGSGAVCCGAGRTAAQTLLYTICKHTHAIAFSLAMTLRRVPSAPATFRHRPLTLVTGRSSPAVRHRPRGFLVPYKETRRLLPSTINSNYLTIEVELHVVVELTSIDLVKYFG